MSIIRNAPGPEEHFQLLANSVARDKRLTPRAARVYIWLRSHSTGWSTNVRSIAKAIDMDPGTVNKAVQDLESLGYVERHRIVDKAGKYSGVEYVTYAEAVVRETPETADPETPETAGDSDADRVPENHVRKNHTWKNHTWKNHTYKKTNTKKTNTKEDQGGLEGVEEPEPTGLEPGQETQSPPQSLDELAEIHAVATSDDVCSRHPHGNPDNVPCHGCRQVRMREQQEAARREAERKGAVVREIQKRNAEYTPPDPLTVDKYPPGVADVGCPDCKAQSGAQCVSDGKPRMMPCGGRLRAGKSYSMSDEVDNNKH